MSEYFLQVRHVSKSFLGVQALKNVDFEIRQGESCCLVGENGCGKSTLIKIISGVYEADAGEIVIEGRPYKNLRPKDAIAMGINVIYQDFSLFPNLSVAENITMAYNLSQKRKFVNPKRNRQLAAEVLVRIGVEIELDKDVRELSVAQRQVVAICRALMQDAKLVIMDEPTTALTTREIKNLYRIIDELKAQNIALVFVSHKLDEVFAVSQRVCILRNGENVIEGSTTDFDRSKMTYYMTGREITSEPFRSKATDGTPLLQVKGFCKKGAFEQVGFELYRGEILGITGLLGCGRTELAEAIFGIQSIDEGEIHLNGKKLRIKAPYDAVEEGIGYVPEDRLTQGLFLDVEIDRNIASAILDQNTSRLGLLQKERVEAIVSRQVEEFSIKAGALQNPVKSLSGGNQQRVVLAKWLAANPKLLILNCPTVGVDVGSKSEIHRIVKELALRGIGIIVISDDLPEILGLCSRILVMNKGHLSKESIDTLNTSQEFLQQELAKA